MAAREGKRGGAGRPGPAISVSAEQSGARGYTCLEPKYGAAVWGRVDEPTVRERRGRVTRRGRLGARALTALERDAASALPYLRKGTATLSIIVTDFSS